MPRRPKLTDQAIATLRRMTAAGAPPKAIASELGCCASTVTCYRLKLGLVPPRVRPERFVISPTSRKLDAPDETWELRRCPFNAAADAYCLALRRLRECRASEVEAMNQEVRRALERMVAAYKEV